MITHLKACYKEGTDINGNHNSLYDYSLPKFDIDGVYVVVMFDFSRRSNYGYGTRQNRTPKIEVSTLLRNTTEIAKHEQLLPQSDVLHVSYPCSKTIKILQFDLKDETNSNYSSKIEINIGGVSGEVWKVNEKSILQPLLDSDTAVIPSQDVNATLRLYRTTNAEVFNGRTYTTATTRIHALLAENGGDINLTWYQLQYAVLQTEAPYYVDNATAEAWVRQYDALAAIADEYQ